MSFEKFQDSHPWQPSWISERNDFSNFESLCHCNASHQVSAQSDLGFRRRCRLKNFKKAAGWPSWILERNDFSNFESLCHCNASHQVTAQSDLGFRRRCRLKNFKKAAGWPSWILERNDFSNFESLCHCDASHQVSAQSDRVWEEMSFEEFQEGCHGGHLGNRNRTILAIFNLCVTDVSIKFQFNWT